jgi:hypothetical protein
MKREPSATTCVYCLKAVSFDQITVDHVIAKSWYPSTALRYPPWKVPACSECNNRFSRIEESVLRTLALCLDPSDPTVAKIVKTVKRSIDPRFGRSHSDSLRRQRAREDVIRRLKPLSTLPKESMLPSLLRNAVGKNPTGVLVDGNDLEAVGKKWIRGVHYAHFGDLVPSVATIDVHFVSVDVAREAFGELLEHATVLNKGVGVQVLIFDAVEGPERITQYAFKIWREFTLYGTLEIDLRKINTPTV